MKMRVNPTGAEVFADTRVVEKLQRSERKVVLVFDKDHTLWSRNRLTQKERAVQKRIMSIARKYPAIASSAQTVELSCSGPVYEKSVELGGLDRPPPQWLLPDGTRTDKIDLVRDLKHLLDMDAFLGFGDRPYVMKKAGYYTWDRAYDIAAGGPMWRSRMMAQFKKVFPDQWYLKHLSDIDQGKYPRGSDVAPLAYRIQFDWGRGEKEKRLGFHQRARGSGRSELEPEEKEFSRFDFAISDESNPAKGRWTSYFVAKSAQKSRLLQRFAQDLAAYSGVPLAETEYVIFGDAATDVGALKALQGAKRKTFGLAACSRLTRHFEGEEYDFEGFVLGWGRRWKHLQPRYQKTKVPGVYTYKPHRLARQPCIVMLLDRTPWSSGMGCAESVLACMEHLGIA